MILTKAYDEIVDFIAGGSNPQRVSEFHPSETAKARVMELIVQAKAGAITPEESSELKCYQQLEHIMGLAQVERKRVVDYWRNNPGSV